MHRSSKLARRFILTALALGLCTSSASAAPPANDNRVSPTVVTIGTTVKGTTVDATDEGIDPIDCAPGPGVWYSVSPATGRLALRLHAGGDLDAGIALYSRRRSSLVLMACARTDDQGDAALVAKVSGSSSYLVHVAQEFGSVAGPFSLDVFAPRPGPTYPGRNLPTAGAAGVVDALGHPEDAFSAVLRSGVTYRVNLAETAGKGCTDFEVNEPSAGEFSEEPIFSGRCGFYRLITPNAGQAGRWSFLVKSSAKPVGEQRFHLQVAPARPIDMAPGVPFTGSSVRGRLNGRGIDVRHVYRFSVDRRGTLSLDVSTNLAFVRLYAESGRYLANDLDEGISVVVGPGSYYAVVEALKPARFPYRLTRSLRNETTASMQVPDRIGAGGTAVVGVTIRGASGGTVTGTFERFDPVDGWMFAREVTVGMSGESATLTYHPPANGRYRVSVSYSGSPRADASSTDRRRFVVG